MGFLILWILGAAFIGYIFGSARTIGFWGCFLISLILSPLLGLIIALFFPTVEDDKRKKESIALQKQQIELLKNNQQPQQPSITGELEKLAKLKADGHLSYAEFEAAKNKLLL